MFNKLTNLQLPATWIGNLPERAEQKLAPPVAINRTLIDGAVLVCDAWGAFITETERQEWGKAMLVGYGVGLCLSSRCQIETIFGRRGDTATTRQAMQELLERLLLPTGQGNHFTAVFFELAIPDAHVWGVAGVWVSHRRAA